MNSKEVMKSACKKKGVQQVASIMNISPTALYNQMNNNMDGTNIVQRFVDFCNATESTVPFQFVAEELNGFFISNPELYANKDQVSQFYISGALENFSHLFSEIGKSLQDGKVDKKEALKIREEWESLKRLLESFVLACEYGYIK